MSPDPDPNLKAAFAELHRREIAEAPPFAAMRERALRSPSVRHSGTQLLLWTGSATAAAALAILAFWSGHFSSPGPAAPPPATRAAQVHVEQLLDSIEQHLDPAPALVVAAYPTDALLTSY